MFFYLAEVNIRGTYVSSWACIFSGLHHLSSSVWLWSTEIDIIYTNCPHKIVCLGVRHVSINHLRCLLPDCIIINLIPITCIYPFTYAHMCKDITVDSSALENVGRGFKTSQQLLEFCWPLDNMLPAALFKIITSNALNPWTPMCDQDRISPYNINTISSRHEMRIKRNIN